jgi:hypothetical protein
MAESGAQVPGCQSLKFVVVTIALVTVLLELHIPCQPAMKLAGPRNQRIQEVIAASALEMN